MSIGFGDFSSCHCPVLYVIMWLYLTARWQVNNINCFSCWRVVDWNHDFCLSGPGNKNCIKRTISGSISTFHLSLFHTKESGLMSNITVQSFRCVRCPVSNLHNWDVFPYSLPPVVCTKHRQKEWLLRGCSQQLSAEASMSQLKHEKYLNISTVEQLNTALSQQSRVCYQVTLESVCCTEACWNFSVSWNTQ